VSLFDRLLGRGASSVTVPVMDGPFLPNQKLETAAVAAALPDADNLVVHKGALFASSGNRLMRAGADGGFELVEAFKHPISALASHGETLAIGLDGHGVEIRGGAFDNKSFAANNNGLHCVTAAAFASDGELFLCSGSAMARPHEWRRSLLQLDASGAVLKLDLRTGSVARTLGDLAWPAGIALARDKMFVAESWRHRIFAAPRAGGRAEVALGNLPAYPARIIASSAGGYWLSFYSVRNQLVEFILQEGEYRRRMLSEIPEPFWMAPTLSSGQHFREPMQGSQLKQMGILKPYAVSRSYGLVAYCDAAMSPLGSLHSRADGERHGAVAACERNGVLYVASRGSHAVLRIADPLTEISE